MATAAVDVNELASAIEVVYKIECTVCGESAEETLAVGSAHGAAWRFYETGWRTTLDDTLCSDCAETDDQ